MRRSGAVPSAIVLLVAVCLVGAGAGPVLAASPNWIVTATSSSLSIAATDPGRQSFSLSGYEGCESWRERVDDEWVWRETCGTWYGTSYIDSGDVGRTNNLADNNPNVHNCIQRSANGQMTCQRVSTLGVTANEAENWLHLQNQLGSPGYAVEAALLGGDDLVSVTGTGAWSFDGGDGTDRFSQGAIWAPEDSDQSQIDEAWTIDLSAGTATAVGYAPAEFTGVTVTDPVTLIDFEDVTLRGSAPHVVLGDADDNWISGAGGGDTIDGGDGEDRLEGSGGSDTIRGGLGDDIIDGTFDGDFLYGGPGNDVINIYRWGEVVADDEVFGGAGDDYISTNAGDDTISGGPGADEIHCGPGEDAVTDAEPADTIAEDCENVSEGLSVKLVPLDAQGAEIDGMIAPGQEVYVEATLKNTTGDTLDEFEFEGGELMGIDPRSPGGVTILGSDSALDDQGLVLQDGEKRTVVYEMTTTKRGLAAANSRVTAMNPDDEEQVGYKSLRIDVEDGHIVDEAVGRWVLLQALDRYLMSMFDKWVQEMDRRGVKLKKQLSKLLSPAERLKYFGSKKGLVVSPFEQLQALLRGTGDKHVAAHLPNSTFKGHTVEELNGAYNESFMKEVGKGAREWAKNWGAVGNKAKKGAKAAYAESLLATFYFLGNATPQERMEFEARMINFADNNTTSAKNLINTIGREIPRWEENGTYMWKAMEMSAKDVTLQSPDLKAQLKQEAVWRQNMLKQADKDPVGFQQKWAQRDAEIFNLGMPLILDTLVGGGVQRLGAVKITGRGTAVVNAGEASGVITAKGKTVKGPTTAIGDLDGPGNVTGGAGARTTEEFLSNVDGATLVKADDYGNVYELPNVGGVPEITLDAKAGILGELQDEYLAATGKNIKLVEVLKPSSPYRKPGGVAKLELTEQKTGKSQMIDAGAPEATFTEASVWRNTEHPSAQPGWKELPKARQDAAVKAWNKANDEWAKWENPPPGSKTERIQECIGQKSRVPLDLEPNKAGIQRFVTAEFEVVEVVEGTAEAKLIRVKSYEVEVVDTNSGRVVNRKTVVDSEVALPQTPDADAVAVGKQKLDGSGNPVFDDQGRPVIEPLTRAEREFVMQRYIDKNVKARRNGTIPDAAEHGVTLVMDDASAQAAGKLLPSYGVPFLSETVGSNYLRRIAPFVKPKGVTDEAMFQKMLELVQSEGGFGQHAVVLTTDTRYLGDLAVAAW